MLVDQDAKVSTFLNSAFQGIRKLTFNSGKGISYSSNVASELGRPEEQLISLYLVSLSFCKIRFVKVLRFVRVYVPDSN